MGKQGVFSIWLGNIKDQKQLDYLFKMKIGG